MTQDYTLLGAQIKQARYFCRKVVDRNNGQQTQIDISIKDQNANSEHDNDI